MTAEGWEHGQRAGPAESHTKSSASSAPSAARGCALQTLAVALIMGYGGESGSLSGGRLDEIKV